MSTHEGEARSTITSTTGGIMTKEVGAVTGDLEVATLLSQTVPAVEVIVRYAGAEEWYTVEGSPVKLGGASGPSPIELRELHERVVERLTRPGKIIEGNEKSTSLLGFSP